MEPGRYDAQHFPNYQPGMPVYLQSTPPTYPQFQPHNNQPYNAGVYNQNPQFFSPSPLPMQNFSHTQQASQHMLQQGPPLQYMGGPGTLTQKHPARAQTPPAYPNCQDGGSPNSYPWSSAVTPHSPVEMVFAPKNLSPVPMVGMPQNQLVNSNRGILGLYSRLQSGAGINHLGRHGINIHEPPPTWASQPGVDVQETSATYATQHGTQVPEPSTMLVTQHCTNVLEPLPTGALQHIQEPLPTVAPQHGKNEPELSPMGALQYIQEPLPTVASQHSTYEQKPLTTVISQHGTHVQKTSSTVASQHGTNVQEPSPTVASRHGINVQEPLPTEASQHSTNVQEPSSTVTSQHGTNVQEPSTTVVSQQHGTNVQEPSTSEAISCNRVPGKADVPITRKLNVNADTFKVDFKPSINQDLQKLTKSSYTENKVLEVKTELDGCTEHKYMMKEPVKETTIETQKENLVPEDMDFYKKKVQENCFWLPGDSDESEHEFFEEDPMFRKSVKDKTVCDEGNLDSREHEGQVQLEGIDGEIDIEEHEYLTYCNSLSTSACSSEEENDIGYGDYAQTKAESEDQNNNEITGKLDDYFKVEDKDSTSSIQEMKLSDQILTGGSISKYITEIEETQLAKTEFLKSDIKTDADIDVIAAMLVKEAIARGVVSYARSVCSSKAQKIKTNHTEINCPDSEENQKEEPRVKRLYSWGEADKSTETFNGAEEKKVIKSEKNVQNAVIHAGRDETDERHSDKLSNEIVVKPSLQKAEDFETEFFKKKASVHGICIQSPPNVLKKDVLSENIERKGAKQDPVTEDDSTLKEHLENEPSINGDLGESRNTAEKGNISKETDPTAFPANKKDFEKCFFKHAASVHGISIKSPPCIRKVVSVENESCKLSDNSKQDSGNGIYGQYSEGLVKYKPREPVKLKGQSEDSDSDSSFIYRMQNLKISGSGNSQRSKSEELDSDGVSREGSLGDAAEAFKFKASLCGIKIQDPKDVYSPNDSEIDSESAERDLSTGGLSRRTMDSLLAYLNPDSPEFRPRQTKRNRSPDWVVPDSSQSSNSEILNISGSDKGCTNMWANAPEFTPVRISKTMNPEAVKFEPRKVQCNNNANSHKPTENKVLHSHPSIGVQVSPVVSEISVGTKRVRCRETGVATGNCDSRDVCVNTEESRENEMYSHIMYPRPKFASKSTNTRCPKQRSVGVNVQTYIQETVQTEKLTNERGSNDDDKNYLLEKVKSLQVELMEYRRAEVVDKLNDMIQNLELKMAAVLKLCTQKEEQSVLENLLHTKQAYFTKMINKAQAITEFTVAQIRSGCVLKELPDLKSLMESSSWLPGMSNKSSTLNSNIYWINQQTSTESLNCSNNAIPRNLGMGDSNHTYSQKMSGPKIRQTKSPTICQRKVKSDNSVDLHGTLEEMKELVSDQHKLEATKQKGMMELDDSDEDVPTSEINTNGSGDGEQVNPYRKGDTHIEDTDEPKDLRKLISDKMTDEYGIVSMNGVDIGSISPKKKYLLGAVGLESIDSSEDESLFEEKPKVPDDLIRAKPKNVEREELKNVEREEPKDVEREELKDVEREELKDVEREELKDVEREELKDVEREELKEELKDIEREELKDVEREELKDVEREGSKPKEVEREELMCVEKEEPEIVTGENQTINTASGSCNHDAIDSEQGNKGESIDEKFHDVGTAGGEIDTPITCTHNLESDPFGGLPQNPPNLNSEENFMSLPNESADILESVDSRCDKEPKENLMEVLPTQMTQAVPLSCQANNQASGQTGSQFETGMGVPGMAGGVDPILFQAVMAQLIQAYPEMAGNQQLLMTVTLQQTHLLQNYISLGPGASSNSEHGSDFNCLGNAVGNTVTDFPSAENIVQNERTDSDNHRDAGRQVKKVNNAIPKVEDIQKLNNNSVVSEAEESAGISKNQHGSKHSSPRKSLDSVGQFDVNHGKPMEKQDQETSQRATHSKPPGLDILEDAFGFSSKNTGLPEMLEESKTINIDPIPRKLQIDNIGQKEEHVASCWQHLNKESSLEKTSPLKSALTSGSRKLDTLSDLEHFPEITNTYRNVSAGKKPGGQAPMRSSSVPDHRTLPSPPVTAKSFTAWKPENPVLQRKNSLPQTSQPSGLDPVSSVSTKPASARNVKKPTKPIYTVAASTHIQPNKPQPPYLPSSTENWDDDIDEYKGTFIMPSTKKQPLKLSRTPSKPGVHPVSLNTASQSALQLERNKDSIAQQWERNKDSNAQQLDGNKDSNAQPWERNKDSNAQQWERNKDCNAQQWERNKDSNAQQLERNKDSNAQQWERNKDSNAQQWERNKASNAAICEIPVPKQTQIASGGENKVIDEKTKEEEEWCEVQSKRKRHSSKEQSNDVRQMSAPYVNPAVMIGQKNQRKSNFDRLVGRMRVEFPNADSQEIIDAITNIRASRGSLSGMNMENILEKAHTYIKSKNQPKTIPGLHISRPTQKANLPPRLQAKLKKPQVSPTPAAALTTPVTPATSFMPNPHPNDQFEEEDICPICHDPLSSEAVKKLDCYHVFHTQCISQWVEMERTCPTCRQHALFPEDFPRLGK